MIIVIYIFTRFTLLGTNISPTNGTFEDDFSFPKEGYVNSLEGIPVIHSHEVVHDS